MTTIDALFDIVRRLRGDDGCPWDREQTAQTMFKCLVEESYELRDALIHNDIDHIVEELGDVLFQLVFIIETFQEKKAFELSEVIEQVAEKMIRRHPHVYKDAKVSTEDQLHAQWAAIKAEEKKGKKAKPKSAMDGIPQGMPALDKALSISKSAVKQGFDWDDINGVIETTKDELDEFQAALKEGNAREAGMEFGDILFSLVNVARFAKIYPEMALAESTHKFEERFRIMEQELNKDGRSLKDLSREEMDQMWDRAKQLYGR